MPKAASIVRHSIWHIEQHDNPSNNQFFRSDFETMNRVGIIVGNPHLFESPVVGSSLTPYAQTLIDRIDNAARETGMMWTPTMETLMDEPHEMAQAIITIIDQ